jgi:hypothetical protein
MLICEFDVRPRVDPRFGDCTDGCIHEPSCVAPHACYALLSKFVQSIWRWTDAS